MTHHFVITSSLFAKILKIGKFCDFSYDILDYNSRTDVLRDVISLIFNQCYPRRPKGPSGGHFVFACRAAKASEARLSQLILAMPSTNAISQITFSALKSTKTYLRTTMDQDRLIHLLTIHVHKTI